VILISATDSARDCREQKESILRFDGKNKRGDNVQGF